MNRNYLNIPISLCYFALTKKHIPELQLYCWLKTQCSGHFRLSNQLVFIGTRQLSTTKNTFKKRLKWLLKNRWITLNNKTEYYHINSFRVSHNRTGSTCNKGALWEYYDFRLFKEFVYTAVLYNLARTKWYFDRKLQKEQGRSVVKAGNIKRGSAACRDLPSFSLPLLYAAKKLNTNKTFIASMKTTAKCAGFIVVKPVLEPLNIKPAEYEAYRKHHPEKHKLVKRRGKLYMQMPDKIIFCVWIKKIRILAQD